jgi:hypothetical protein
VSVHLFCVCVVAMENMNKPEQLQAITSRILQNLKNLQGKYGHTYVHMHLHMNLHLILFWLFSILDIFAFMHLCIRRSLYLCIYCVYSCPFFRLTFNSRICFFFSFFDFASVFFTSLFFNIPAISLPFSFIFIFVLFILNYIKVHLLNVFFHISNCCHDVHNTNNGIFIII